MLWIVLAIIAVLLLSSLAKSRERRTQAAQPRERESTRAAFVERLGTKFVPADEVFQVWQGWDLERMLRAERLPTNPIDRHFLLLRICEITYKRRQDTGMRSMFLQYAKQHVAEFEHLAGSLREDMRGALHSTLPHVPTFEHLATVLTEDGDFDAAEKACRPALSYGLHDNTKGGFEGRIARIRKTAARKMESA